MIIGHQRILDFFKKSVENHRLAHAYLFLGSENLGKYTVALELIKKINGADINLKAHPDVLIVEPETLKNSKSKRELEISINQIRKIKHQLSLSPYSALYKTILINQADKMTAEASNCLLKTLEEPSKKSILILIASNAGLLLPTIVSRCQSIKFLPVADQEIIKGIKYFNSSLDESEMTKILRLSYGRPGIAIQYLNNPELIREYNQSIDNLKELIQSDLNNRFKFAETISKDAMGARRMLHWWMFWLRDAILIKIGCKETTADFTKYSLTDLKRIVKTVKQTDKILGNASFNARLALEVLMLEL